MLRSHRRAHARIWSLLVVLLPLALLTALTLRPNGPVEKPAVPIDAQVVDTETAP